MSPAALGVAIALAALVLYASTTLLARLATDRLDSAMGLVVVMSVTTAASGLLLVGQAAAGQAPTRFPWPAMLAFCAAGVFSAFLGRWLLFESVQQLGAARASVFLTSSPLFTALFGWAFLAQRPGLGAVVAMLITLCGLVLVADPPVRANAVPGDALPQDPAPGARAASQMRPGRLLLGLTSACAYALGNVSRAYAVHDWHEPLWGTFLGAATGLVLQMLVSWRGESPGDLARRLRPAHRGGLLLYGLVALLGMAAQVCTIVAMRYLPVAEVTVIMTGTPLIVFPVSFLFLRRSEALTWRSFGGLLLALGGIGFLVWRTLHV